MENTIQNKCIQLWEDMQAQMKLSNDIELMLKSYVEANRKFANGEIVLVCDRDTDKVISKGAVMSAKTFVRLEPLWLKGYTNDEKFNNEIKSLRYEIFAVKKDGTPAAKHLFHSPHFINDGESILKVSDVYIKKLDA